MYKICTLFKLYYYLFNNYDKILLERNGDYMSLSKNNPSITLKYLKETRENLYFERKKAKVGNQVLANEIAAFANANGGVIAVGVTDNGEIEGFNNMGINKLNECQKIVTNYLNPTPKYNVEVIDIINEEGEEDKIVLFHISPSTNSIIRNNKDEVYLRQGDSSIKLNNSQIKSLEYERGERNFETEIINNSSIDDIDREIMDIYKKRIDAEKLSDEQILKARGFLVETNGNLCLTKSGMLLFGKNPSVYLPNARVRVLKFEGLNFQVGTDLNIVKDKTFDKCLYKTIEEVKDFVNTQLREFTYLNADGIFETVPEFPEFAWFEGIVNAVTHRDYSNTGEYITVKLFDDRLEIYSPGKLGGFVTIENIQNKRYSRNPQIARVLVEFGLVRELNEGVKRIYREMKEFYLKEPVYSEPDNHSVLLVLDNNIEVRSNRKKETMLKNEEISQKWKDLNYLEQRVLQAIYDKGNITSEEVSNIIERGKTTSVKLLNKLIDEGLIVWTGTSKNDNYGKYIMR